MYVLLFGLVMVSWWDFVILVLCYGMLLVKGFYCVVEGVFHLYIYMVSYFMICFLGGSLFCV